MKEYNYPEAKKISFSEKKGNKILYDSYQWLENANDLDVLSWVKTQNEFTDSYFLEKNNKIEQLSKKLEDSVKKKTYINVSSGKNRIFATKIDESSNASIVELNNDFQEISTIMSSEIYGKKISISKLLISPDESNGIIFVTFPGDSKFSILIYNFHVNQSVKVIKNIVEAKWGIDSKTVYFTDTIIDKEKLQNYNNFKRYNLEKDEIEAIYEIDENAVLITLGVANDGGHVFFTVIKDYVNTDVYYYSEKTKIVKPIVKGILGSHHYIGTIDGIHFFQTNKDADNFKIVAINVDNSQEENWKIIVPESDKIIMGTYRKASFVYKNYLIIPYIENVSTIVNVFDKNGKLINNIPLPLEIGTAFKMGMGMLEPEINNSPYLYIEYESFFYSPSILRYDILTNSVEVVHKADELDDKNYVLEQKFVNVEDGIRVPMFIMYKKDTKLDGMTPTLMYGYGGYGLNMPPTYENKVIGIPVHEWVDKGNIYVNCNIRGGKEYGTKWHAGGRVLNKKNSYYDFIACAEWLIENKYTCKEKLAACGVSNGGLLMATMFTMRPDLFRAIVASVPHTDLIRFKNDDTGPMYINEYGDPDKQEDFEYLLSYSPYHNVKDGEKYPSIIIQTGEKDNNVPPYHSKKFVALVQEKNGSDNPILLRVLADGSHDRGTGKTFYRTISEFILFLYNELGIKKEF